MVHESKEALNIIEDMMEGQIISTEDADLMSTAMVSSIQLFQRFLKLLSPVWASIIGKKEGS